MQAMHEFDDDEADSQLLTYKAMATVLMRIDAGEEGLYDPNNPTDRAILNARQN
jgi:hypothetical protein